MNSKSSGRRRNSPLSTIMFLLGVGVFFAPLTVSHARKAAFRTKERQVLKAFSEEFPAAEVIETTYEGSAFAPDPVTVYAIDTELGFPFISNYHHTDGYVRSKTELGCYELRLKARQSADRVAAQIPQYLSGSYTVRFAADGSAGFAVFMEESDRETLTALWNGLREAAEGGGTPMYFSIIWTEPDLLEQMLSRPQSEIIRAQRNYRSLDPDTLATQVPNFWEGGCSSLFYDYVTDPAKGFDHIDRACQSNSMDRFVRQLHSDPARTEYIMTVFNVW